MPETDTPTVTTKTATDPATQDRPAPPTLDQMIRTRTEYRLAMAIRKLADEAGEAARRFAAEFGEPNLSHSDRVALLTYVAQTLGRGPVPPRPEMLDRLLLSAIDSVANKMIDLVGRITELPKPSGSYAEKFLAGLQGPYSKETQIAVEKLLDVMKSAKPAAGQVEVFAVPQSIAEQLLAGLRGS